MRFYRKNKKQNLDLSGNFIMSKNPHLIEAGAKSSAPRYVQNGRYILVSELSFRQKLTACVRACAFIMSGGNS